MRYFECDSNTFRLRHPTLSPPHAKHALGGAIQVGGPGRGVEPITHRYASTARFRYPRHVSSPHAAGPPERWSPPQNVSSVATDRLDPQATPEIPTTQTRVLCLMGHAVSLDQHRPPHPWAPFSRVLKMRAAELEAYYHLVRPPLTFVSNRALIPLLHARSARRGSRSCSCACSRTTSPTLCVRPRGRTRTCVGRARVPAMRSRDSCIRSSRSASSPR